MSEPFPPIPDAYRAEVKARYLALSQALYTLRQKAYNEQPPEKREEIVRLSRATDNDYLNVVSAYGSDTWHAIASEVNAEEEIWNSQN